jgi:predicted transcriptional regulator
MLELRLEGKLSNEEYQRLQSMYDSTDKDNQYVADQALKSLKENL